MRQIRIFFWLSKVICQFVWLFPCFVRVGNPFVNLKLHFKNLQKSKQKQFHVQCSIYKSYKMRKWTTSCIGNFEENMDLSCMYLAVLHNPPNISELRFEEASVLFISSIFDKCSILLQTQSPNILQKLSFQWICCKCLAW